MDGFTDSSFDREHTRRAWTVTTSHLQRSSLLPCFSFLLKQSPRWTKRIPPASFFPLTRVFSFHTFALFSIRLLFCDSFGLCLLQRFFLLLNHKPGSVDHL